MILKPYADLLNKPLSFWAVNANAEKVPDIVRVNGILPVGDDNKIIFFISERLTENFRANLELNPKLAFSATSTVNFESYQFKGQFESIRPCTPEEEKMQYDYIMAFSEYVVDINNNRKHYVQAYYHQPSFAVSMHVTDIFEQTPRKGTGSSVVKK